MSLFLAGDKISATLDYPARVDLPSNKDYVATYYGSINKWRSDILASPNVEERKTSTNLNARILASPASLSITVPADEASLSMLDTVCSEQVRLLRKKYFCMYECIYVSERARQGLQGAGTPFMLEVFVYV
jgi:hypothetical protein